MNTQERNIQQTLMNIKNSKILDFLSGTVKHLKNSDVIETTGKYFVRVGQSGLDVMRDAATRKPIVSLVDPKSGKIKSSATLEVVVNTEAQKQCDKVDKQLVRLNGDLNFQMMHLKAQNIAIMEKLEQISLVLDKIQSSIADLKKMQNDVLLGELDGIRDLLAGIQDIADSDMQREIIANAIESLYEKRGSARRLLYTAINKLPDMPRWKVGAYLKQAMHVEFADDVLEACNEVDAYCAMYMYALRLLAYAYAFAGQKKAYERVFADVIQLEESMKDKLIKAEWFFQDVPSETWYKNEDRYMGKIIAEVDRIFVDDGTYVEIEVSGQQLLEAMNEVEYNG